MGYKLIEHTADVGIFVEADNIEDIFKYSAQGMLSIMTDENIKNSDSIEFEINGDTVEELLHDFLTELLYLFEVKQKLFKEFKIKLSNNILKALCYGEESSNINILNSIKAITYHKFKIEKIGMKWQVHIFFDL